MDPRNQKSLQNLIKILAIYNYLNYLNHIYLVAEESEEKEIAEGSFGKNTGSSPLKKPGGIDLNATKLNLDIRGQSLSSPLIIDNVPFSLQNFQGFTFQIIKFSEKDTL